MKALKKHWKALNLGGAKAPPLHEVDPKTLLEISKDLRKIGLGALAAGGGSIVLVTGASLGPTTAILLLIAGALIWASGIVLDALARRAAKVDDKEH